MSVLIRYRHLLLLALFLFNQIGVTLHELDIDNPDHLRHVQCQLCVHANGLDLAPFETMPAVAQSVFFSDGEQKLFPVSPETAYSPVYHSRAPPRV